MIMSPVNKRPGAFARVMFRRMAALAGTLLVASFAGAAHAALITIDFELDGIGAKANGFLPTGVSGVSFSDTNGTDLFVGNFGAQGAGTRSLLVGTDIDASAVRINLAFQADFFSLDFGNDDPTVTNPGDLAELTAFLGATQVGQTTLGLNRDDIMNQTITVGTVGGAVLFDSLTFAYTNSAGSLFTGGGLVNFGASEIVDTIAINSVAAIPEPVSGAVFAFGLAAIRLTARRRRRPARTGN